MRKHYPLNSAGAEDAGQLPWTDGVPQTGAQGSFPGHAIVTDAEAEILNAAGLASLVQSGTDLTQLGQAISRGIFLGGFTGSANALAATLPNGVSIPSLLVGMRFSGLVTTPNTGSVTVALAGFGTSPGVLSLLRGDGQALTSGDLPLNRPFDIRFDGSAFRVTTPVVSEFAAASSSSITNVISTKTIIGGRLLFFKAVAGSYPWTCPAGVTQVRIRGVGGGGAGGAGSGYAGAGAFGGNYFIGVFDVVPGQTYTIVVGAGGTATSGVGNNGGSTYIKRPDGTTIAICYGGTGGGPGGNSASNNIGVTGTQAPAANNTFPYGGYELLAGIPQQGIILPGPTNIGGLGSGSPMSSGTVQPYNGGAFNGNAPGGGASGGSASTIGGNGADGALFIEG